MASPTAEMQTGEMHDVEKVTDSFRESSSLVLSEDRALAKARSSPKDALPILITYGVNDGDNPRNWPRWRKWYITCLVSMLNVFTYAEILSLRRRRPLTSELQNLVRWRYLIGGDWNPERVWSFR
jgi:hypothetical protein